MGKCQRIKNFENKNLNLTNNYWIWFLSNFRHFWWQPLKCKPDGNSNAKLNIICRFMWLFIVLMDSRFLFIHTQTHRSNTHEHTLYDAYVICDIQRTHTRTRMHAQTHSKSVFRERRMYVTIKSVLFALYSTPPVTLFLFTFLFKS